MAAPTQIELPDGTFATEAKVDKVATRAVECTLAGETVQGGGAPEMAAMGTHVKVEVRGLDLKETRKSPDGLYMTEAVHMTKQKKDHISLLEVELCGETYDLMTSAGKLQFMFAKDAASLPMQALLSCRYKSPMGGAWYVDKQPINLELGVTGAGGGGCCVLM